MNKTTLKKGESIVWLGYTIKNSENSDGVVLSRRTDDAELYETHLGNFGNGDEESVLCAKHYALAHFLIRHPDEFSTGIARALCGHGGGHCHEWYSLRDVCKEEGIEIPEEITDIDPYNCMIAFNGKKFYSKD